MSKQSEMTRVSKFISLVLRHQPDAIGLSLDCNGWASVDDLIRKSANASPPVVFTEAELHQIVASDSKRRYSFDPTMTKIRANQGHSIDVDLGLTEAVPPLTLYHGTTVALVDTILETGIKRMQRQHVHLTTDHHTAAVTGARRGKPAILHISAKAMHDAGYAFWLSDNGVWLTEYVPPKYVEAHYKE